MKSTDLKASIKRIPAFTAAVHPVVANYAEMGKEVRKSWRQVDSLIPKGHPMRLQGDVAYTFSPQRILGSDISSFEIKIGVQVESHATLAQPMELFQVPEREYVTTHFRGGWKELNTVYFDLINWIKENGYELDQSDDVYWIETYPLNPVNPFEIPHDQIETFDYEISMAVVKK
ncbi:hypothetical protein YDYSG_42650 [Paenibacillus tyrfis]|uniref:GyrI-like domain-containing protein n=1 Tax=Paenibacillus TaxID=44249 RepID=UPI002490BB80|nr:GyrI-like domain-containing protein [Paenibacillus tyrfis]GLI08235.1 hypothetical protein YDYSG_42650 [Paenibacillus tyrfis]GMX63905.1 hypothetical protein Elgi_04070 [Paenibacillus elgii]